MAQDRERRKGKGGANDKRRIPKKKTSILTSERIVGRGGNVSVSFSNRDSSAGLRPGTQR